MSANGIEPEAQLQLQYFHPVLRDYYKTIREAALPDNFSETHRTGTQNKSLQSAAPGQFGEPAITISTGQQGEGKSPDGGNSTGTAHPVEEVQQSFQFMSDGQTTQPDTASFNGADASSGGSNASVGTNLNVRA